MALFKIGNFQFINLSRLPSYPQRQMTREARPGVNGITLWLDGVRAPPQMVRSVVDCATLEDALGLVRQYEAIVGSGPVDIQFSGSVLNGVKAIVGGVAPMEEGVRKIVKGIGGTAGNSQAILYCDWILHIIDAQQ